MSVQRIVLNVEMEDGTQFADLRIKNPALVAYDLERTSKKWQAAQEVPMFWRTFIAWRQLVNQGDYAGTFAEFRDKDCADIDQVKNEEEEVDPTREAAESTPALPSPS